MNHPEMDAKIDAWLLWVEKEFPFDPRCEKRLRLRQDRDRPACGSRQELEDLRGVADPVNLSNPSGVRTRFIAAVLARMWFGARELERSEHWRKSGADSRVVERDLDDLDKAIDATPAGRPRAVPQREMFG